MTYGNAIAWLNRLPSYERTLVGALRERDMTRMKKLLALLGNPEQKLSFIHVTGSKGKGSVVALLEAVLCAHGSRVSTFTSPHVFSVLERVTLCGTPISRHAFAKLVQRVRPAVLRLGATYFEALTALALIFAREKKVSFSILEVGLGGRLDATNAVETKKLTMFTHIEREHEDVLGTGLPRITREKLCIARPSIPLISAMQAPAVLRTMKRYCSDHSVPLFFLPKTKSPYEENRALAVFAARKLLPNFSLRKAEKAMARVHLPGRLQRFSIRGRAAIFDMSHTPDSARFLRKELDRLFPKTPITFCFAAFRDKRVREIFRTLLRSNDRLFLTTFPQEPRAISSQALFCIAKRAHLPVQPLVFKTPADLLRALPNTLLCFTGSSRWADVIAPFV